MEPVMEATKLKTVIYLLRSHLDDKTWEQLAMPIADAIAKLISQEAEIRRLARVIEYQKVKNESLQSLLDEARQDRDYWQHKWGNGSA